MGTVVSAFYATGLLLTVAWGVVGLFNVLVWRRSRSGGHLLMLVASGWLTLDALLRSMDLVILGRDSGYWSTTLGVALFASGFYVSLAPLVGPELARLLGRAPKDAAPPGPSVPPAAGAAGLPPPPGPTRPL